MARKIRVLHIITRLIAAGADENTIFTVQGINDDSIVSHLFVGRDSEIVEEARLGGIVIFLNKNLVREINIFRDFLALFQLTYFLKKNKYDIVHTHTAKAGIIGRWAAKIAGVPIIIHTLHGLSFHDFMPSYQKKFFILLEKSTARFTDLLISVGENIKWKSIYAGITSREKYSTIYSGMDLDNFKKVDINRNQLKESLKIANNEFIVGTVSRLEPRKGPQYFIEVIERVKKSIPNIKGILVGCGSFRSHLEKKIRKLNLDENIILTGYRKDIAEIMSIFDLVCLTSLWEGIPRVLVQAALLGKPLIGFDIDGNSEVIKQGINGFLVPPKDIEECANKIIFLLKDDDLRNKMSLESKNIIDSNWDKDFMVKEIRDTYIRLINNKNLNFNKSF